MRGSDSLLGTGAMQPSNSLTTEPSSWRGHIGDGRGAVVAFGALEVIAMPLILFWGRHGWFGIDDWDFLADRKGGSLADLIRPHYHHWTTIPVVEYRMLWSVAGIRSYWPYLLVVVLGHLSVAALLRVVMRRSGVGSWLATALVAPFIFFGAGAENILVAFQITFVGALAFGLVHLLLVDHDGCIDRRDWFGLAAGLAGLMCSGVAIAMVVAVGITTLLRRGWRVAVLHTAPLGVVFVTWWRLAPMGQSAGQYGAQNPIQAMKFIGIGAAAAIGGLGGISGLGAALALILLVGAGIVIRQQGWQIIRTRVAVPVALLGGAFAFLAVTATGRAGAPGLVALFPETGPERARLSRYVYVVAAMLLPALGITAQAIVRNWPRVAVGLAALLAIATAANTVHLATYGHRHRASYMQKTFVLTAPRLPIASRLPPSLTIAPDLPIGWLITAVHAGRVPAAPKTTAAQLATFTLRLSLQPSVVLKATDCQAIAQPERRTLRQGSELTVTEGTATITYAPPGGARSRAERLRHPPLFPAVTLVAMAGPLPLRIAPGARSHVTLCSNK